MEDKNEEKINNELITKELLSKSLSKNILFYSIILLCLYLLSKNGVFSLSFLRNIVTLLFISMFGYFIHFASHHIDIRSMYSRVDNIFTRNENIRKMANMLLDIYDFHDKTHHDIEINKEPMNIFYEFTMNVYTQGVGLIVFIECMKMLDYRVIILWAFLYATVHNINYIYLSPSTHRDHHIDPSTNYGIDTMDILFNSKYDKSDIEDLNHASINLILITCGIIYFTK